MVEMEERQLLEYGVVGIWCRRHDRTTVSRGEEETLRGILKTKKQL